MGRNFWEHFGLPQERMPWQSLIEVIGKERLLIEHHHGVTEYGDLQIRIKVGFGTVCIRGKELVLRQITASQLIVCGDIMEIALEGGVHYENR